MKWTNSFLSLALIMALISCANDSGSNSQDLLGSVPILEVGMKAELNSANVPEWVELDSLPPFYHEKVRLWGRISGSEDEVAFVSFALGGDYPIPIFEVFEKHGKLNRSEVMSQAECGSGGCGFSCRDWIEVSEGGEIVRHLNQEIYECDQAGDTIPGTRRVTEEVWEYSNM